MPSRTLDDVDWKIIAALQADGRLTTLQLAERVGLSPSPCARRVRLLEAAGDLDRFARAVAQWPEVLDCYLMTGQRDFLLRIVVGDLASYERFLKDKLTRLDGVSSIESSFALGQVKRSNVLPLRGRG